MALATRAELESPEAVVPVIVQVGLEWRLRCPSCTETIVMALGSRAAFDETTQVGQLNVNEMRSRTCECGYRPPKAITPLPLELTHSYLLVTA